MALHFLTKADDRIAAYLRRVLYLCILFVVTICIINVSLIPRFKCNFVDHMAKHVNIVR